MSAPAIDEKQFREVCARFPTGVCVVTSFGPQSPSGLTANAVASLSLVPPLMIVCFDRTARTLVAVEHSRRFAINILAHDQEQEAARFASKLPEAEKFEGVRWHDRSGAPLIEGGVGGLVCDLRDLVPGGDHVIGIGEVVDLWKSDGEPLLFFGGSFWALAEREPAPAEVDEALEGP